MKPNKQAPKTKARNPQASQAVCVCVFLVLAVFFVFGQTAGFGFVNYDDSLYVYENPVVQKGLTFNGMIWALTYGRIGHWHPLTWLSHMADCQIYGLWAGGHHLTNVALHAFSAVLLFLVLRKMTDAIWRSAFAAALFALHPLRSESVAWIAERKDVLSGVFFMLTLWAYAAYARQPSRRRYVAVAILYFLGLLSKNMLVTLPFVLLLLDAWPLGRMKLAESKVGRAVSPARGLSFRDLVKEKLPLFLLSAGSCVATALVPEKLEAYQRAPFFERVGNALVSYLIYLRQMFLPAGLANPYPSPPHGPPAWSVCVAFVALAGISAGAAACWKKRPFLLVGWLWYLGMLVPAIGIVQISYYAHADRYTYLPEIGLAVALTWGVADWTARWKHRRLALSGLMIAAIGTLAVCARHQTAYWKDSETLWKHTLACTTDNSIAEYNLANALVKQGRVDEAIAHFQKNLRITPDSVDAMNNLGNAFAMKGDDDAAIVQLERTLAIRPDHPSAHYNLANLLFKHGRFDEAITHFRQAAHDQPNDPDAQNGLAISLLRKGDTNGAINALEQALKIVPGQIGAINNLALLLATASDPSLRNGPRAAALANQAIQANGGPNPVLLHTLAAAYAAEGNFKLAADTARRALALPAGQANGDMTAKLQQEIKLYEANLPSAGVPP